MLTSRAIWLGFVLLCLLTTGCCDKRAMVWAFNGKRSLAECAKLKNKPFPDEGAQSCPGDDWTIYWEGNVDWVDYGTGKQGPTPNMVYVSPTKTLTIQVHHKDDDAGDFRCGGSATINVLTGEKPIEMATSFDLDSQSFVGRIEEVFYSSKLRVIDIRGNGAFYNEIGSNPPRPCFVRPVASCQQSADSFNFDLPDPMNTFSFPKPLKFWGTWRFKQRCMVSKITSKDLPAQDAMPVFILTLKCIP
jgi:hypothetical protein